MDRQQDTSIDYSSNIIFLENYRTKGSKVFLGRDRGLDVAKRSKIKERIDKFGKVIIVIPDDIYCIHAGFLQVFLNYPYSKFKSNLLNHVEFISNGSYDITHALNSAFQLQKN